MKIIRWTFFILLGVCLIIFALSNRETVVLQFYPFLHLLEIPLYLLFFVALMLGVILGGSAALLQRVKSGLCARRNEQRIRALENELAALKVEDKITTGVK